MAHDLEDIEDIQAAGEPGKAAVLRELPPRVHRQRSAIAANADDAAADEVGTDVDAAPSGVPGTQRVWVKTFGCSHNFSDGEYMAGLLQAYGYRFDARVTKQLLVIAVLMLPSSDHDLI